MSDLQDALDWMPDGWRNLTDDQLDAIVDAARRYANPDYEAALQAWTNTFLEQPNSVVKDDDMDHVKAAVNAALGITEPV